MLSGTLFISSCWNSASSLFLSIEFLLEEASKSSLSWVIKISFSAVASPLSVSPSSVVSAPGIGIVEYLPLIVPSSSFANAKVYFLIQDLPGSFMYLYLTLSYCIFE